MRGICSTGHPWSDGAPACSCDAAALPADYAPILVAPLTEERPRTIAAAAAAAPATATATAAPPPVDPILSDDGWWQWDGSAWVPADVPPTPTPSVGAEQAALPHAGQAAVDAAPVDAASAGGQATAVVMGTAALQETPDWATWSAPAAAPGALAGVAFPSAADAPTGVGYTAAPGHAVGPADPPGPGYGAALAYAAPPGGPTPPGYAPSPGNAAPAYYGPPTGSPPWGDSRFPYNDLPQEGRDGLAIAALVCSLIPVVVVTQVLAVIFAIIVLTRVARTRKKGQVMAIVALCISVPMFFLSVAIAIPVFLHQRQIGSDDQVRSALRATANAEETYYVQNATYADAAELNAAGGQVPAGIDLEVAADRDGYCLAAAQVGGSRWLLYDSFDGGLQTTIFRSSAAAFDTCASSVTGGGAGETAA